MENLCGFGSENKKGVVECYPRDWMKQATMFIEVCVNDGGAWVRSYDGKNHADVDGYIISEHICLAVADCGLGICWVCYFDPEKCSKVLDLSEGLRPMIIIPIGYPASEKIPEKT